jgi:histidine ammonia-lyase
MRAAPRRPPAVAEHVPRPPAIEIGGRPLTADDVDAVARLVRPAVLAPDAPARIARCHAFVRELARAGTPVYGLTTGCGPLASHAIAPDAREQFQRNLVRSHATTLGSAHPVSFVRAAMVARAHVLALGHSGVDPAAVDLLLGMLNAGLHPLVREVGSVGASGDLVELAEIALAMLGEGRVTLGGRAMPAAVALQQVRLEPLAPTYREGIALINGTSFHTGVAALLATRADHLARAATIAAAMGLEALCGNVDAMEPALAAARPHPGHEAVAHVVLEIVRGSTLVDRTGASAAQQDAYTLRCIPQILGAVVDELAAARRVVETELNAITDNPLFLPDEGRVVHGGNFHGQPVAMALDRLKAAVTEIGVASERRVARLLDPTLNKGLPPFLIMGRPGAQSGLMGLQYCASSLAADNAVLSAPASVHSVPTNANNQDVVSMGMVAAKQAARVLDNVTRMVAVELICAAQALELRGCDKAGAGTRAALAAIRVQVDPIEDDRPLGADVEAIAELVGAGALPYPAAPVGRYAGGSRPTA